MSVNKTAPQAEAGMTLDEVREEILRDYRIVFESREASLLGRKEVLTGKAKFGIFGDGKELAQVCMAKQFRPGDWRSGYYRDMTFMFAIGQLTVQRGDVIWNLMTALYGTSTTRAMKRFEEVNPHLKSIDVIVEGDVLNFPAIPAANMPPPWVSWVALAESGRLDEIFHLLRQYPGDLPPARIVSWWTGGGGLRFALCLRQSFSDDKSALQAVDALPVRLSKNAKVLTRWEEGTVFFSALTSS